MCILYIIMNNENTINDPGMFVQMYISIHSFTSFVTFSLCKGTLREYPPGKAKRIWPGH